MGGGSAVTVSKDTQQRGLLEHVLLLWKRHCRAVAAFYLFPPFKLLAPPARGTTTYGEPTTLTGPHIKTCRPRNRPEGDYYNKAREAVYMPHPPPRSQRARPLTLAGLKPRRA